jgi:hypothetical protein
MTKYTQPQVCGLQTGLANMNPSGLDFLEAPTKVSPDDKYTKNCGYFAFSSISVTLVGSKPFSFDAAGNFLSIGTITIPRSTLGAWENAILC